MSQHIDAIAISEDGHMLVGTSDLTGRLWLSSICLFKDPDSNLDDFKYDARFEHNAGISDLKFIGNDRFVCGFDCGSIQISKIESEEPTTFTSLFYQTSHDSLVSALAVSSSKRYVASSGYDKNINLWNIEENTLVKSFNGAHFDLIHSLAYHPENENILLSCGQDNRVLLWDTRKEKPASIIVDVSGKGTPTAISWNPRSVNSVAVGNDVGEIVISDITNKSSHSVFVHRRAVRKIAYSPSEPSKIASCSDDNSVSITDLSKDPYEVIYKNSSHKDFVRDVEWNVVNGKLYSCSWDNRILSHSAQTEEQ